MINSANRMSSASTGDAQISVRISGARTATFASSVGAFQTTNAYAMRTVRLGSYARTTNVWTSALAETAPLAITAKEVVVCLTVSAKRHAFSGRSVGMGSAWTPASSQPVQQEPTAETGSA